MARDVATRSRPKLSRERIVAAAVELADTDGIDALSMRALAKRLGCEAMSLYNHIADKADLLVAMADQVAGEIALAPIDADDWRTLVRQHALDSVGVLAQHRWAAITWITTPPGPQRLELGEWLLSILATTDLDAQTADHAFHAVVNHIMGTALQMTAASAAPHHHEDGRIDLSFDPERFPHSVAHLESHNRGEQEPVFEFMLDLILDALQ